MVSVSAVILMAIVTYSSVYASNDWPLEEIGIYPKDMIYWANRFNSFGNNSDETNQHDVITMVDRVCLERNALNCLSYDDHYDFWPNCLESQPTNIRGELSEDFGLY